LELLNVFLYEEKISYNMKNKKKDKDGITIKKILHPGWVEWERLKYPKNKEEKRSPAFKYLMKNRNYGPFGRWHYHYSSSKGSISLIELKNYNFDNKDAWEIYSYDTLFQDVIRFPTKEEAEKKIREVLAD
jgi:hypothetical protein